MKHTAQEPHNRYSRQILFDGIGARGQEKFAASTVVVLGCGGLGTVAADILVRAGVGTVRIIDRDIVDESNLQRQTLFDTDTARRGLPKAEAARLRLEAINPTVRVEALVRDFDPTNACDSVRGADVVIDATDNLEARYLLNDVAVNQGIPWIYGAALGSTGMYAVIVPGETPCLRCLYEEQPPPGAAETCDTAGIIAPATHVVAAMQCAAAMKLLVGGKPEARLVQLDVWSGSFQSFGTAPGMNPDCPCCVRREFKWLDAEHGSYAASLCGRDAVQISWKDAQSVDFDQLAKRLAAAGEVSVNRFTLRLNCEDVILTLFRDGRAIVSGTSDPARARELYARYIG